MIGSVLEHFYFKLNESNPTLPFNKRTIDPKLVFDLESERLNGVPLGSVLEKLRPFGVADSALGDGDEYSLDYASIGLAASFRAKSLISFEIAFDAIGVEHPTRFSPCPLLAVITRSGEFHLTRESSAEDLSRIFGAASFSDKIRYKYGFEKLFSYSNFPCRVNASLDDRSGRLIYMEFATKSAA